MAEENNLRENARQRKKTFHRLVAENETYPLATITYHGPHPDQATKISVGIIPSPEEEPTVRNWQGEDIAEDVQAAREIASFLKSQEVERVITSEMVLSCPHVEGVDYPEGEECPYCSFWQDSSHSQAENH
jgi:hypothetical protein